MHCNACDTKKMAACVLAWATFTTYVQLCPGHLHVSQGSQDMTMLQATDAELTIQYFVWPQKLLESKLILKFARRKLATDQFVYPDLSCKHQHCAIHFTKVHAQQDATGHAEYCIRCSMQG